jgi:transglutaminase-like putative cysteine protease
MNRLNRLSRPHMPRIPLAPEEGWLSLGLVAVMAVTAAWSIDDAGWVLGRGDLTNFLPWAAVLGVLVGFVGAKVGWNRWVAHTIGAVFAALIVPILVGAVLPNGGNTLGTRFDATAAATTNAWSDLIVHSLMATRETGHHLLVLGLLCWGTGQFAASAVFRHRRPLSAVVVIGAIVIANMAATLRNQLSYLILFSLASLFLLIRLHALDESATWARRRIGDPTAVRAIYLRGGTIFIILAVVGSLVLTATAKSAPLAGAWDELKPALLDVSAAIARFLPVGGDNRGIGGVQFGPTAVIQDVWSTNTSLAVTIQRPPGDARPYYWRAVAYDRFNFYGWEWTETTRTPRAAGDAVLAGTPDDPPVEGGKEVTFTVTPAELRTPYALSPLAPIKLDRNSELLGLGEDGFFEALQIEGHEPYVVTARVPLLGDEPPGALTQNALRVAGTTYPDEIRARYLPVPPGTIGPDAKQVLDDILAKTPNDNPFDVAATMVRELQGPRFRYEANVSDVDCGDRSAAECFAFSKKGYCQHYATLMTILLREHGIPARFVQGFLPGGLNKLTGTEQISNSSAHAWVEVWFPGHGWVIFDPTGGNRSQVEALPSGRPVAPPSAAPSRSTSPDDNAGPDGPNRRSPGAGAGTTSPPTGGGGPGPFIVVSLLLLGVVAGLAFLAWQRGPRGPTTPEGVYAGVARLAARLGFGPRPTQTAYEYAAALGDVLPNIRPELHTVATAKVEVAYGRRTLGDERIQALRESYRRLRVGLLRLLFRRRDRPRRR